MLNKEHLYGHWNNLKGWVQMEFSRLRGNDPDDLDWNFDEWLEEMKRENELTMTPSTRSIIERRRDQSL